jgi:hypothetical protein
MPGSNSDARRRFCHGLSSNIVVQYSVCPIITLHGNITAREYVNKMGNQVHPMIQTLFLNNDAPIHTAGNVQSWFEEHEGELNTFPGQHNQQIGASLNHSSQFFCRTE